MKSFHLLRRWTRFSLTMDVHLLEAHEVVAMLKAGKVSPLELIDIVEQRINATEALVHATPITCFDRAREKARQLDTSASGNRGFLYGLPVLVKDTHAVEGVRFTEGSLLHADRIAEENAPLVAQLESKGAIIVGKTNVPEFCAGSQSFNCIFPTTVSPWDTRTTAGGSSGGSAAALASFQCWLASGTDMGGSVRTPAAFCGTVGFRVSPGRTPTATFGPLLGLHSISGPMARSVRDVALFLDALESSEGWAIEPHSPSEETFEAAAIQGAEQGIEGLGLKIGFSTVGCKYSAEVEELCRKAAQQLNNKRDVLEVGEDRVDFEMARRTFSALRAEQFAQNLGEKLRDPALAALVKPEIQWNVSQGQRPDIHLRAEEARGELRQLHSQIQEMFKSVDILCVPASLDAAFDAEVRYPTKQIDQTFSDYLGWMTPASTVTMFLCPALVLPCGFLKDGRPVGLQVLAAYGGDAMVLRAAAALERHLELPKGIASPRRGTCELRTEGPRTAEEAAKHHGICE
eukprot:symbB.v1.2.025486.t1/scaffold2475.1/size78315/5